MHILLVIVAVHPARNNTDLISLYLHYTTILNLTDIMLPIMLNQIRKFENLNIFIDIFINVYLIEEQKEILPLWLTDRKRGNMSISCMYRIHNDNTGHFALDQGFISP